MEQNQIFWSTAEQFIHSEDSWWSEISAVCLADSYLHRFADRF